MTIDEAISLEEKFGNPIYIFDETAFEENYCDLVSAMRKQYHNYCLSYSFKTNYTPYVCSLVMKLGGYAEVVSIMEYEIARKVGFPPEKIIFNGPNKSSEILEALKLGSIINADNLDEIETICEYAKENAACEFKIGVRVNLDIGQSFISRFGMDFEDIKRAFGIVSRVKNLQIVGLHCHISRCRNLEYWKKRTEVMISLADELFISPPDYIDLGSGMFGKMEPEFQKQFENVPSYEQYAQVTAQIMSAHYHDTENQPILFTEPGTTLINKYFSLLARIDSIKIIRNKSFVVLNCSEHNLGETCTLKQLPMRIVHSRDDSRYYSRVDFVGYTCLEQDVMYKDFSGQISKGDYVLFGNVGGYSNVLKPPFIRPNCAMVAKTKKGKYQIIKRAESTDDILRTYSF